MSLVDYIISVKMIRAMHLLGQGYSVRLTAAKTGTWRTDYFVKQFRKRFHCHPRQFIRKQVQAPDSHGGFDH